jgi:hypothetical protein
MHKTKMIQVLLLIASIVCFLLALAFLLDLL